MLNTYIEKVKIWFPSFNKTLVCPHYNEIPEPKKIDHNIVFFDATLFSILDMREKKEFRQN